MQRHRSWFPSFPGICGHDLYGCMLMQYNQNNIFIYIFFCLTMLFFILFFLYGYQEILQIVWNIPTKKPYFADIRTITGVNATISMGFDPLVNNPGDPWGRTMNYPRIWQKFAELVNLNHNHGIYFGLFNVTDYVVGFIVFIRTLKLNYPMTAFLLLCFFSPASILGIERGNTDILIFAILVFAIICINKSTVMFSILILMSAILKLFPILSYSILLRERKNKFLKNILIVMTIFGLYVVLTFDDIILIRNGTPQAVVLSYGMNIIPQAINNFLDSSFLAFVIIFTMYCFIGGVFLYTFNKIKIMELFVQDYQYIDSFRAGGAIFLGTFLFSNNWDYRLIFLIFTIPQLLTWGFYDKIPRMLKLLSIATLLSISYTMWFLVFYRIFSLFLSNNYAGKVSWLLDEISNWIIFTGLLVLFLVSLPNWVLQLTNLSRRRDNLHP